MSMVMQPGHLDWIPDVSPQALAASEMTVGDLHGNTLKWIYVCIQNGLMTLPEPQAACYIDLCHRYARAADLTLQDIDDWEKLFQQATYHPKGLWRLLGDELADRGQNDYLTLLLMRQLVKKNVKFEVMLSNHNHLALQSFDNECLRGRQYFQKGQEQSLLHMWSMLEKPGFELQQRMALYIAEEIYKPRLKLVGYHVSIENAAMPVVTLFTHAPVGLETIKALAAQFSVDYQDTDVMAFTACLDHLNQVFQAVLCNRRFADYFILDSATAMQSPVGQLMWARSLAPNVTLTPSHKNFMVRVVHGHVGSAFSSEMSGFYNLDNNVGKGIGVTTDDLMIPMFYQ
jgi:hypothetical protein